MPDDAELAHASQFKLCGQIEDRPCLLFTVVHCRTTGPLITASEDMHCLHTSCPLCLIRIVMLSHCW